MEMNIFTEYRRNLEKINFTQQQMKECSTESRKHKRKIFAAA